MMVVPALAASILLLVVAVFVAVIVRDAVRSRRGR
jgi:hypothetical protein